MSQHQITLFKSIKNAVINLFIHRKKSGKNLLYTLNLKYK